jgi:hypothetical protein
MSKKIMSKHNNRELNDQIMFKISEAEKEAFQKKMESEGKNPSAFFRAQIRQYLAEGRAA